jgi:endonuclease/exonuclease/phosphatase family metal-dependent hydrolase
MSATRLRLLTFNIAHGRGLSPIQGLRTRRGLRNTLVRIADLVTELKVDIVAFQEIDQASRWAGNFDQLEYLRRHARFPHGIFGITNRREGLLNLCYGNALLSRFPILRSESVVFGRKRIGEKGFLFTELDIRGHVVPLINLHLHYRSRVQRMSQLEQLTDWLAREHLSRGKAWHMPPIICGDFNAQKDTADAPAFLLSHLQGIAAYRLLPRHHGPTFPSAMPVLALDFVLVPPGCHRAAGAVVKSFLSDHRPVLVEFEV